MTANKLIKSLNNKGSSVDISCEDTIKSAFSFVWYDACKEMWEMLVREGLIKEGTSKLYPLYPKKQY